MFSFRLSAYYATKHNFGCIFIHHLHEHKLRLIDCLFSIIFIGILVTVDGGWSDWCEWSMCSVSCGHGLRMRTRQCDNPAPACGGAHCHGDHTEEDACYAGECYGNRFGSKQNTRI